MELRLFAALPLLVTLACQETPFRSQADLQTQGVHLRMTVQSPARADLLFVVDNSASMAEEQAALRSAMGRFAGVLAAQNTDYRLALVSTDAEGFNTDCCGAPVATRYGGGARLCTGNCTCASPAVPCGVALNRPHDGTGGRLVAAYDASVFATAQYAAAPWGLDARQQQVLGELLPSGLEDAVAVIDRRGLCAEACTACGGESACCDTEDEIYTTCAQAVVAASVQALFDVNIQGIGRVGGGWEQGLRAALQAVGIDPQIPEDTLALSPLQDLTEASAPNVDWIREDATLGLIFVSDEEDCSMPDAVYASRSTLDAGLTGSLCYRAEVSSALLDVPRMATLLAAKKGSAGRVAVGVVAGIQVTESEGRTTAIPSACRADAPTGGAEGHAANPACRCLEGEDSAWCSFARPGGDPGWPGCEALAGGRYLAFASAFDRRRVHAICDTRRDEGYGAMLEGFARMVSAPCFQLRGVRPGSGRADQVRVTHTPLADVGSAKPGTRLVARSPESTEPGFYYDAEENRVCLTGLERSVGDRVDIYVLIPNAAEEAG